VYNFYLPLEFVVLLIQMVDVNAKFP